jgi:hypothetical protein
MSELCRLIWCGLMGFFRSRASLEAEILVLRHQLNILRRKSAKRPTFGSIDRLVIAGLYGFAPSENQPRDTGGDDRHDALAREFFPEQISGIGSY